MTDEQLIARGRNLTLQRKRLGATHGRKKCKKCGEVKFTKRDFSRRKDGYWRSECNTCRLEYVHKWRNEHPAAFAEAQRRGRKKSYASQVLKYRKLVYEFLGNRCNNPNCGFSDPRAFQIDHVNDDGHKEREGGKYKGSTKWKTIYKDLVGKGLLQSRYQLLCANCNAIKEYERRLLRFVEDTPSLRGYLPD